MKEIIRKEDDKGWYALVEENGEEIVYFLSKDPSLWRESINKFFLSSYDRIYEDVRIFTSLVQARLALEDAKNAIALQIGNGRDHLFDGLIGWQGKYIDESRRSGHSSEFFRYRALWVVFFDHYYQLVKKIEVWVPIPDSAKLLACSEETQRLFR